MAAVGADLRQEVEAFLYYEARLLDAGQLDEWLALCTPDIHYWIPSNGAPVDPETQVSIVYDERERLEARIWRLKHSGIAYAQIPPSRLLHCITNIEVEPADDGTVLARSNLLLLEVRRGRQLVFGGQQEHRLVRTSEGWRIAAKTVTLLTNDLPIDNLTFIV